MSRDCGFWDLSYSTKALAVSILNTVTIQLPPVAHKQILVATHMKLGDAMQKFGVTQRGRLIYIAAIAILAWGSPTGSCGRGSCFHRPSSYWI